MTLDEAWQIVRRAVEGGALREEIERANASPLDGAEEARTFACLALSIDDLVDGLAADDLARFACLALSIDDLVDGLAADDLARFARAIVPPITLYANLPPKDSVLAAVRAAVRARRKAHHPSVPLDERRR